jgi:hypothetical protein
MASGAPVALVAAGLAVLLGLFIGSWLVYASDLQAGIDGSLYTFTLLELARWSGYFDQFVLNPYQGMGTVFLASNLWFNPGRAVFAMGSTELTVLIASYSIFVTELYVSTVFLGRALRLPMVGSVLAGQFLCLILFPPFLRLSGLIGLFILTPGLAHVLAVGNVLIGATAYLGRGSGQRNALIIAGMCLLTVYVLFCEPLFSVTFLAAAGLFFVPAVVAMDFSGRRLVWGLTAAASGIAILLALDGYDFLRGCFQYAARTVFTREIYGEVQTGTYAFLPFQNSRTLILFLALLAGSIAGLRHGGRALRPLFIAVFAEMAGLLALSFVYLFTEANWVNPIPVYLEMSSYAIYLVAAVHGAYALRGPVEERLRGAVRAVRERLTAARLTPPHPVLTAAVVPVLVLAGFGAEASARRVYRNAIGRSVPAPPAPRRSSIVDQLASEIALAPGSVFRGSATSVFGVSGGPLARHLGYPDGAPFDKWVMANATQELLKAHGNSHALADLWRVGVPTLEEYSPLVSPFFYVTISRLLARPQDHYSRNYGIITNPDVRVLPALGVRFLLTDLEIADVRVTQRAALPLAGAASVRLYELANPNLGTYSPTRVHHAATAAETLAVLRAPSFDFARDVVLHEPHEEPLVPAAGAMLRFERGGVRLSATSPGRSLLLLPLQFSHCYAPAGAAGEATSARMLRANLTQAAIIFERQLDVRFEFRFGLGHGRCRVQDSGDVDALQLRALAGQVRLPPRLHPHAVTDRFGGADER